MKKTTRVNHPPSVALPPDNRALVAPVYNSVKFTFDDTEQTEALFRGERAGFYYSRSSNPTLRQLELLLAELQGQEECLLTGSGCGAIAACLIALCKSGDHLPVAGAARPHARERIVAVDPAGNQTAARCDRGPGAL